MTSFPSAVAAAPLPPSPHPADDVRRAARVVLSRREFRRPPRSLLQRARDWVVDELRQLAARLFSGGRPSVLAWAAVALVVVVVAVLAVRYVRGFSADPEVHAAQPPVRRRSGTDWRADAQGHEARGEWREGLRCRYRALVSDLASRGLVEEVPGRTAGEYRAEVARAAPAAAGDFSGATELFERAWYGNRPTGPDEAGRFGVLADGVLAGARG